MEKDLGNRKSLQRKKRLRADASDLRDRIASLETQVASLTKTISDLLDWSDEMYAWGIRFSAVVMATNTLPVSKQERALISILRKIAPKRRR